MRRLAARHPAYGWEANMGYGTAAHQAGLLAAGPCSHHRRSFAPVSQLSLGLAER
jgi:ribonuclease HII